MKSFLEDLKPSLSEKVITSSFNIVIANNYVMQQILQQKTDQILTLSMSLQKPHVKNAKKKS